MILCGQMVPIGNGLHDTDRYRICQVRMRLMVTMTGKRVTEKKRLPPRERILIAATDLFYRQGIRGVGVEAIAQAADTNKMALYRHFASKDELVAEWLRRLAVQSDEHWSEIEEEHPSNALEQLLAWLRVLAKEISVPDERGCPFTNSTAEILDKNHPARRVIEDYKIKHRDRIMQLCKKSGLREPELVADQLFFLMEGARASAQYIEPKGDSERLIQLAEALIESHREESGGQKDIVRGDSHFS